jgi:hypothetical protein
MAHDVYPDGVADMVGYWAEDRILGGVTVFDRQPEEQSPQFPPNVYFHSCRAQVTHRYYQLRDDQQQALIVFLLAENSNPSTSPLPILGDSRNLVRINEEEAVVRRFYRDVWERKPPMREHVKLLERAPRSVGDYPEYEGFINYINTNFDTVKIAVPSEPRGNAVTPNNRSLGGKRGGSEGKETGGHGKGTRDESVPIVWGRPLRGGQAGFPTLKTASPFPPICPKSKYQASPYP